MGAKQVWLKDGKLQTYTNHWEEVNVGPTPTPVAVTGVSLDQSSATLQQEETLQLTATVSPDDATDKRVTWGSSNTSVATVSSTGLVTAGSVDGDATITVTTRDGNYTDTCAITVNSHVPEVQSVEIEGLTGATIYTGRSIGATIKVNPYTASDLTVSITSSDESVIELSSIEYIQEPTELVTGYAYFTGVGVGTATITITSNDNPSATATYEVTVQQDVPVASVSNLSSSTANVYEGETTYNVVSVEYLPTNAVFPTQDISITLKDGETSIGYGYIEDYNNGVANITFICNEGHAGDTAVYEIYANNAPSTKLEVTLTVVKGVSEISNLSSSSVSLGVGATTTITADYLPIDATDFNNITFVPSVDSIATASVQSASLGTITIEVTGVALGTTSFDIQIDGSSTGETIAVTVEQTYTVTLTPRDSDNNQQGGGTLSNQSLTVPAGAILYSSSCYDVDPESLFVFQDVVKGTVLYKVTETPDTGYDFLRWEYYDESVSDWEMIDDNDGLVVSDDVQVRCSFSLE